MRPSRREVIPRGPGARRRVTSRRPGRAAGAPRPLIRWSYRREGLLAVVELADDRTRRDFLAGAGLLDQGAAASASISTVTSRFRLGDDIARATVSPTCFTHAAMVPVPCHSPAWASRSGCEPSRVPPCESSGPHRRRAGATRPMIAGIRVPGRRIDNRFSNSDMLLTRPPSEERCRMSRLHAHRPRRRQGGAGWDPSSRSSGWDQIAQGVDHAEGICVGPDGSLLCPRRAAARSSARGG